MLERCIAFTIDWALVNIHLVIHIGMTIAVACFMAAVLVWIPYVWQSQQEQSLAMLIAVCVIVTVVMLIREFGTGYYRRTVKPASDKPPPHAIQRMVADDLARKQRALDRFKDEMEGGD